MNEPTQEDIEVVARAIHDEAVKACRERYPNGLIDCVFEKEKVFYIRVAKTAIQAMQSLGYVKLDDLIGEANRDMKEMITGQSAVFALAWLKQQKLRSE